MARRRSYEEITNWVKQNEGKHFCACGCGAEIKILRRYSKSQIPRWLNEHKAPKVKDEAITKWVEDNTDKHLCKCGCGGFVKIRRVHIHRGIPERIKNHQGNVTEAYFWSKATHPDEGCWEWQAEKTSNGYGAYRKSGQGRKIYLAHRYAYELAYGAFDKKLFVCHKCDNPQCIRPDHLFLGTNEDNMKDAVRKQRQKRTLSNEKVREIVKLKEQGENGAKIALKYDVAPTTIYSIFAGETWSHVTGFAKPVKVKKTKE